jgi:signal transduction histidine kinase
MSATRRVGALLRARRPVLRAQLTLLYSGLFLAILAGVLLATNLLYGHTAARAPAGTAPGTADASSRFDVGPALIGLAAAVLALAGAWWLAGRFLRPLHAITTTAQRISASNLNQRLAVRGPDDELTRLGTTLNDLLSRLESAFTAQRHFVANASHELRTPLAGQRTLLQVALADPHADLASLRAACAEAVELGAQQEKLIDALLVLATSERGIEHRDPFDLGALAGQVLAGRRAGADERGVRIDATLGAAPATGDPRLVELLVANLVDNAIRHNRADGTVEIVTGPAANSPAAITVRNTGPVIPPEDLDRIFQPFQRAGGPRLRHRDGHGLGLAIVAAIAGTHRATIATCPRSGGGLEITVAFPTG